MSNSIPCDEYMKQLYLHCCVS